MLRKKRQKPPTKKPSSDVRIIVEKTVATYLIEKEDPERPGGALHLLPEKIWKFSLERKKEEGSSGGVGPHYSVLVLGGQSANEFCRLLSDLQFIQGRDHVSKSGGS